MIKLRRYQNKLINGIRNEFAKGNRRVIMQSITGSGKTVMFTSMVKSASEKGLKCLILTDRVELLKQAGGTFDKFDLHYHFVTAKTKHIPNFPVLVAMVETMKRRAKTRLDFQMLLKRVDLLIIDEAHKLTFFELFKYLKDDCYIIGATATPVPQKKKPLCDYYDSIVCGPSTSELVDIGFLSKPKYFGVQVDLSSVRKKGGEFREDDMEKVYGEAKLFEGLKHNLEKYAKGKKTMIFAPSINASLQVAGELNCMHVDGAMDKNKRTEILSEFEDTPGAIITNVGITTTGYDCPSIECIVLYRATTSLPLYLQMIGRGSRVTDTKKSFMILDFGMNVQRFGYWHIERQWSLSPPKTSRKKKKDVFPIKFCPECGAILSANKRVCDECGYTWPIKESERVFAELRELSYKEITEKIQEATVEEMENMRLAKGYKVGFLLHKFKSYDQFEEYEKFKGYKSGWARIQAKNYGVL